ncbi:hypothetical protein [Thalassotalea sp. Y01]|uniref:hypothetical protein n=1 Tax=Thalassotalea sp. Y01 TaxID=2729613 RepID=UPI00145E6919|nr:hypothetical protein [Thalassotalea sp. Y01]NMP16212.1 hypothetical protein [Thalassotalea sp. Y01]
MPKLRHLTRLTLSVIISALCFAQLPAVATEYYVNPTIGNDNNLGTSKDAPIKSLDKAKRIKLQAGDKLLFAAGKTYWGSLVLNNLKGSADKPIIVSTYIDDKNSDDAHAKIIAKGMLRGIEVVNSSHLQISNFIILMAATSLDRIPPTVMTSISSSLIACSFASAFSFAVCASGAISSSANA